MFKNLISMTAAALLILSTGPAFATHKNGQPHGDMSPAAESLEENIATILNLLEPKTIFVTSSVHNGDLDGLPGADQMCQDHAEGVFGVSIVPSGVYVALLSTDDVHATERITPSSGPYIRPDGVYVAANAAGLFGTDGGHPLINNVLADETGDQPPGVIGVWTGTLPSGTGSSTNCEDWESGMMTDIGSTGVDTDVGGFWLLTSSEPCGTPFHLYCVGL